MVNPKIALPPEAMPWGRWATQETLNNNNNLRIFKQDIGLQNAALHANVALLSEQIRLGADNVYDKPTIDGMFTALESQLNSNVSSHTHDQAQIGGVWDKSVNTTGTVNAVAGIKSIHTRSNVVATSYAGMWVDVNGNYGISPSSIQYKTDLEDWTADTDAFLSIQPRMFRYKTQAPEDAKQIGFIAEEVMAAGFPEFVFYDAEGNVQGLNYDRMVVGLLEVVKQQDVRIKSLEQRMVE